MDAKALFLDFHRYTHGDVPSSASMVMGATPDQMRVTRPGHNSIAWLLWHIARGEDWAINAMLRGEPELWTRDGWMGRCGVEGLDWGPGMSQAEVDDLSHRIDIDALKEYYRAVAVNTRDFIETFDFERLDEPFDAKTRLAEIPHTIIPAGHLVRRIVDAQTTQHWFLSVMAQHDPQLHIGEAGHMYRVVVGDESFP